MLSKTYKQARQRLSQPVVPSGPEADVEAQRYFTVEASMERETLELAETRRNHLLPIFAKREDSEADIPVDETLSSPVAA